MEDIFRSGCCRGSKELRAWQFLVYATAWYYRLVCQLDFCEVLIWLIPLLLKWFLISVSMALHKPNGCQKCCFQSPRAATGIQTLSYSFGWPQVELYVFVNSCLFIWVSQRQTSSWTICQTYLPFSNEATHDVSNGGQNLCASINHHTILRPLNAIQAVRPVADQWSQETIIKCGL